jgi:hypothetical protein
MIRLIKTLTSVTSYTLLFLPIYKSNLIYKKQKLCKFFYL